MNENLKEEHPIDAVVLWVDGSDEKHLSKIVPYLEDKNSIKTPKFRNRFIEINEIQYTIDSLLKYAPYLRNIFLITDEQIPAFLEKEKNENKYSKISIVDHTVIFSGYEEYLPTFNSRSIETFMFRIPNLAEHFIYLNDDFFIIDKTQPSDFFKNGFPVLRGKWIDFDENKLIKKIKKINLGHKTSQQKGAKLAGAKKYYNFKHTPHPFRKSTFEECFKNNKEVFLNNIQYKFRNNEQFLVQSLINHIEIENKTCVLKDNLQLIYFRTFKKPLIWYKIKLNLQSDKKLFLALQSLYLAPKPTLDYFLNWLDKRVK